MKTYSISNVQLIATKNVAVIHLNGETVPLFRSISQFRTDLDNSLLDNGNIKQTASFLRGATFKAELELRTKGESYTDSDGNTQVYKTDAYAIKRKEDEQGNNVTPFLSIELSQANAMQYNIIQSVASSVRQSLGLGNLQSAPKAEPETSYDESVLDNFGNDNEENQA